MDLFAFRSLILFFSYIFRAHILQHGRTLLWVNWTDSAERAAVWTSGCPSSTCLSDELLAAKTCERTFICTGGVVWTLMDTLPPRDQIPKHCWYGKKNLEEKKRPRCRHGVYLKEKKKSWGMDFHCGQDCLELRLSALATEMRWRGTCIVVRWKFVKACVCFLMWSRTLYRRIISCMFGKSLCDESEKWGETRKWSCWVDQGLGLSLQKQKHLLKHWTFCNFTYLISIVNVDVAIVII